MIQLPPGFDYTALFDDFVALALPFVSVSLLFCAYKLIAKVLRG